MAMAMADLPASRKDEGHNRSEGRCCRLAFVTLATHSYQAGAIVLTGTLREMLPANVDVVIYTDDAQVAVGQRRRWHLPPGVQVRFLSDLPLLQPPPEHDQPMLPQFSFCWRKLALWTLTEYDTIVYMDCDMLPLRGLDDLARQLLHDGSSHASSSRSSSSSSSSHNRWSGDSHQETNNPAKVNVETERHQKEHEYPLKAKQQTNAAAFLPKLNQLAAVPACQCWCGEECVYTDKLGAC